MNKDEPLVRHSPYPHRSAVIPGWVMSGAGNRFIVLRYADVAVHWPVLVRNIPTLCQQWDPPVDGLIVVEVSRSRDVRMYYWNPDGSSGMMCGNGGRCAAAFAVAQKMVDDPHTPFTLWVEQMSYRVYQNDAMVQLRFPPVRRLVYPFMLEIATIPLVAGIVDNGSDHLVLWYDQLPPIIRREYLFESFPLASLVKLLWQLPPFRDQKVNVNLVQQETPQSLRFRTFERGVDRETPACGTGAIAVAAVAAVKQHAPLPQVYHLLPPSGQELSVRLEKTASQRFVPTLIGNADFLEVADLEFGNHTVRVINSRKL